MGLRLGSLWDCLGLAPAASPGAAEGFGLLPRSPALHPQRPRAPVGSISAARSKLLPGARRGMPPRRRFQGKAREPKGGPRLRKRPVRLRAPDQIEARMAGLEVFPGWRLAGQLARGLPLYHRGPKARCFSEPGIGGPRAPSASRRTGPARPQGARRWDKETIWRPQVRRRRDKDAVWERCIKTL